MLLVHGTRIIVDNNAPAQSPYVICFQNGCMSDYDISPELLNSMKKGQNLVVQAISSNGQPVTLALPLSDFAKAYDGPPTDPKQFEENQKKLQEELQKRAEDARKKLESNGGAGHVFRFRVLGEQVIERLILMRANLFRNRQPPFLGVVEFRIDVEDHATEGEDPVADDLSDLELGGTRFDHSSSIDHDGA
jgi:hypothetical protein